MTKRVVTPSNLGSSLSGAHKPNQINVHPERVGDGVHYLRPVRVDLTANEIGLLSVSSTGLEPGYEYRASDTGDYYLAADSHTAFSATKVVYTAPDLVVHTSTSSKTLIDENLKCLGGDYLVTISYGWNCDSTSRDFISNFLIDGARHSGWGGALHQQEPKDHTGNVDGTRSSQALGFHRVLRVTLSRGTHNFKFRFKTETNGVEASIWGVCIVVEKVLPADPRRWI